jgi:hypothetical protein
MRSASHWCAKPAYQCEQAARSPPSASRAGGERAAAPQIWGEPHRMPDANPALHPGAEPGRGSEARGMMLQGEDRR